MGEHTLSPSGRPEPVVVLDAVKGIVALLGGFGFLAADDPLVQYGSTGVALLVFVVLTILTRRRVTPMTDPQLADGTPVQELIDRLAVSELDDGTPVQEILDRLETERRRPR